MKSLSMLLDDQSLLLFCHLWYYLKAVLMVDFLFILLVHLQELYYK